MIYPVYVCELSEGSLIGHRWIGTRRVYVGSGIDMFSRIGLVVRIPAINFILIMSNFLLVHASLTTGTA